MTYNIGLLKQVASPDKPQIETKPSLKCVILFTVIKSVVLETREQMMILSY